MTSSSTSGDGFKGRKTSGRALCSLQETHCLLLNRHPPLAATLLEGSRMEVHGAHPSIRLGASSLKPHLVSPTAGLATKVQRAGRNPSPGGARPHRRDASASYELSIGGDLPAARAVFALCPGLASLDMRLHERGSEHSIDWSSDWDSGYRSTRDRLLRSRRFKRSVDGENRARRWEFCRGHIGDDDLMAGFFTTVSCINAVIAGGGAMQAAPVGIGRAKSGTQSAAHCPTPRTWRSLL